MKHHVDMTKIEKMLDAIGAIDFKYVQEAESYRAQRGYAKFRRLLPIAACLAIALGAGAYGLLRIGVGNEGYSGGAESAADLAMPGNGAGAAAPMESAAGGAALSGAQEEAAAEDAGEAIYFNEITELSGTSYDIAAAERTEYYSAEALEGYFGVRLVPQTLPEDFGRPETSAKKEMVGELRGEAATSDQKNEMQINGALPETAPGAGADAQADGATAGASPQYAVGYDANGNVVNDNNTLRWQSADGMRSLSISARTCNAGEVIAPAQAGLQESQIAGCNVLLAHYTGLYGADGYLGIYEKDGVTVTVQSGGMTQDEFLGVLEELLMP